MNDEDTQYHEPTQKGDTNPYENYPYGSLPEIPPAPPKQKHTLYRLSLVILVSLCLVLGTMVVLLLWQERVAPVNN